MTLSTRRLLRSIAIPLAAMLALTSLPMQSAEADVTAVQTRTLQVLQPGNTVITDVGVNRGRGMERESLGVALATGAVIEARVTNGVNNVKLSLMTDDHTKDIDGDSYWDAANIDTTLPASGAWTQFTASAPSGVFVRTRAWGTAPIIEYRVASGTGYEMPEYRRGDNKSTFMAAWDQSASPFAVILDTNVNILMPIKDKEVVRAKNLDALIDGYRDIFAKYDSWLGVNNSDPNTVHRNLPQRYFVRPDRTGWGLAYYASQNYIGTNNDSVSYYLDSASAWLILHEVGHGYDGFMTGPADSTDIGLGEVYNNIYAYHYQTLVANVSSNWLYGTSKATYQEQRETARENAGGVFNLRASGPREKLDFMVRIADLTTIDGFRYFNRKHRELQQQPGGVRAHRRSDLIAEHWGGAAGYNLAPWFDVNTLPLSTRVTDDLYDVSPRTMAMPLSDLYSDYSAAQQAATQLGIDSPGSLVPTSITRTLPARGSLTVTADIANNAQIDGRPVKLYDGATLVASGRFVGATASFTNVPVGTYTVRYPQATGSGVIPQRDWVQVRSGGTQATKQVTYPAAAEQADVNGAKLELGGLANAVFASVDYNNGTKSATINDSLSAPHSYFSDEYARVTVKGPYGAVRFDRSFVGNAGRSGQAAKVVVPTEVGSTIEIRHRENNRLYEKDSWSGNAKTSLNATSEYTTYTVTQYGLVKTAGASALNDYKASLSEQLASFSQTVTQNPSAILSSRAAQLKASIAALPTADQGSYLSTYGATLDAQIALATGLVGGAVPANAVALDRSAWSVTATSSHPTNPVGAIIDGNNSTIWHNDWTIGGSWPYTVGFNLGAERSFTGFSYLPRQDGTQTNGRLIRYELLAGPNAAGARVVSAGEIAWQSGTDNTVKYVDLGGTQQAAYVALRFVSANGPGGQQLASGAEFNLHVPKVGGAVPSSASWLSRTGWTATATDSYSGRAVSNMLDGNTSTFWHNDWVSSPVTSFPYTVAVDMAGLRNFSGFSYLPRQDGNTNGRLLRYELLAGSSAATASVVSTGEMAWTSSSDNAIKYVSLGRSVPASYVALRFLSANGNGTRDLASGSEFVLYN